MNYVYLLRSQKTQKFYIGSTANLRQRFYQHNHRLSIATKADALWELVYYEAFPTKTLALQRERKLKHHGRGLLELKKRLGFR